MDNGVTAIISVIVGAVLTSGFSYYLSKKLFDMQRKDQAASKFRSTILFNLNEVYPENEYCFNVEVAENLSKTIPVINLAAAEFSFFVKDKEKFKKAVNQYSYLCSKNRSEENCIETYAEMFGEQNKKVPYDEQLECAIEHLLSFADNK